MRPTLEETAVPAKPLTLLGKRAERPQETSAPALREHDPLFALVTSPTVRRALQPVAERLLGQTQGGVFCVASAEPGEGRTVVAATLSLMLSESTEKGVLLVDAHLRNPSVRALFGLPDSPGLAECLRGECRFLPAVSTVGGLRVLPAGRDESPARLFSTPAAKRLVEQLRDTCNLTLIDLPPLTSSSEAATLCDWSDGTIMVVRANSTRASTVLRAVEMIDRRKVVGVVLNRERQELPRWLERLL